MAKKITRLKGSWPIDVFVVDVKDPLHGHQRLQQITGGGVLDAFWLASGAGGIEDEERVLGIKRNGWSVLGFFGGFRSGI